MKYSEVARFGSRLEAEAVGHALDAYDIPFLVQSGDTGMFGPGMVGWSPAGAMLMVPEDRVEEVQELLNCVVRPLRMLAAGRLVRPIDWLDLFFHAIPWLVLLLKGIRSIGR